MKRGSLLHSLGIWVSSFTSIFAGHSLMAKGDNIKELTKTSKKLRPNQAQSAGEDTPPPAPQESLDQPGSSADRYPWKKEIVTTTFWVGEKPTQGNPVPNHKSSWDGKWAENYGGTDSPDRNNRTSEFIPSGFVPRQNPFYVALPYNDKTSKGHKPEARQVIPWFHKEYRGPGKSVCKGRWIAIRKGDRVCYAQWEDAGPFRTDNWEYVFGPDRPLPNLNKGAGLDVSPAVRDFLGMEDTDVTDWKFVDFDEVPSGPWAAYGDNNTFVINQRDAAKQFSSVNTSAKAAVD
ncbi:MAG TPA: hypothetical protein VIS71_02445 [Terrimicrobium sp.]